MPHTPNHIFNDKLDFIDKSIDDLRESYSVAERWLFSKIINEVLPELDIEDGKIKNTNTNITILTNKLNSVMERLRTGKNKNVVNSIIKDMGGITNINNKLFKITGEVAEDLFDSAKDGVETIMQKSLGFNPDGSVKPNSFIDSISSVDDVNNTIRESAIRQIQGGNTIADFTTELEKSILTNESGLGILNKNRGQIVNDRFAQYDRAESKSFADVLKMQAFIYSGGKVQDTRKFCCQRNGLIFTNDEAQQWSRLSWEGKNAGYTPLIDLGGYNCRHSAQYISNRVALRRRKDLTIDENGKLVSKTRKKGPKLHSC